MDIYWGLFLWAIFTWGFCAYMLGEYKDLSKKVYFILNYIPLTSVACFRGESVGADSLTYIRIASKLADKVIDGFYINGIEFGFAYLCKMVILLTGEPYYILTVVSIFTILGFGVFFYLYSDNFYVSTLLFITLGCYTGSFITIRQYLAIMISFWGVKYLWEAARIKSLICFLVGLSFHTSTFVFLPLLLLHPLKKVKMVVVLFFSSIVISVLYVYGMDIFVNIIFSDRYIAYIGDYQYGSEVSWGPSLLKIAINIMVVSAVLYTIRMKEIEKYPKVLWLIMIVSLSCFFVLAGYKMSILGRFVMMFMAFLTLLIPYWLSICNKFNVVLLYPIIICMMALYYYRVLVLGYENGALDYCWYFW